jgi:cytochrome c oxidase subunit III
MATKSDREQARNTVLWLFLGSVTLLFASFTSAYIVRRDGGNWLLFDLPSPFLQSTIVLLISSLTVFAVQILVKRNRKLLTALFMLITLILGLVFTALQWKGWEQLVEQGIYLIDNKTGNVSGSFFFVITAVHLAHLISGILALLYTTIKALLGKYDAENYQGLRRTAIYWHFLDFLWLYLYLFLEYSGKLF